MDALLKVVKSHDETSVVKKGAQNAIDDKEAKLTKLTDFNDVDVPTEIR